MPVLCFAPRELGFRDAARASAAGLKPGVMLRVRPILLSQGINEEQSVANLMQTHTAEQTALNERALAQLSELQAAAEALARARGEACFPPELLRQQRELLVRARQLLSSPPDPKNVGLLHATAALTRLLDGGRATLCKSGKDRTAMSITLEHTLLLQRAHGLSEHLASAALTAMRRHGVRRENVRQNTNKRVFAFNWMQQRMLPEAYRPPDGSAKSGAA